MKEFMTKFELLIYLYEEHERLGHFQIFPASIQEIEEAETFCGHKFPPLYKEYMLRFGNSKGSFFSENGMGIDFFIYNNKHFNEDMKKYGSKYGFHIKPGTIAIGGQPSSYMIINVYEQGREHTVGIMDFQDSFDLVNESYLWGTDGLFKETWIGDSPYACLFKSTWLELRLCNVISYFNSIFFKYHPLNFVNWDEYKTYNEAKMLKAIEQNKHLSVEQMAKKLKISSLVELEGILQSFNKDM
jgi:hypothetical protein